MDEGLVLKPIFSGGLINAVARSLFSQEDLMINMVSNPTKKPLSLSLSHALPGEISRLNPTKNGIVVLPGVHLAHTSGVGMGIHWLGFSSWLAGEGLLALKLYGRGRIFLSSYGSSVKAACSGLFMIEHHNLLAYSPKLRLKVNFPKGIIGDESTGKGLASQLIGTGNFYWQSRNLPHLGRFIRLKLR